MYLKSTIPRYFLEAIHKETELLTTRLGHRFAVFSLNLPPDTRYDTFSSRSRLWDRCFWQVVMSTAMKSQSIAVGRDSFWVVPMWRVLDWTKTRTARLWESLKRARFSRQANSEQMCFYIKQTYKMIKDIFKYTCTAKTKHVSYKKYPFQSRFQPSINWQLWFIFFRVRWVCFRVAYSKEDEMYLMISLIPRWSKVTFLGWLSDPFKGLSDLQLGDEKGTLNHLASNIREILYKSVAIHWLYV